MKNVRLRLAPLVLAAVLFAAVPASAAENIAVPDGAWPPMTERELDGFWSGVLPTPVGKDGVVVNYVLDATTISFDSARSPKLLLSSESMDFIYSPPNDWRIENDELVFTRNDPMWLGETRLHLDGGSLVGTYTQKGRVRDIRFERAEPPEGELQTQMIFEGRTGAEWTGLLQAFGNYTVSVSPIRYEYDLQNLEKGGSIYRDYQLGQLMETTRGYRDIDRMKAVLDVVCDQFKHDGAVTIPEGGLSPQEAIDYCLQNGAIECRGLSTILAEMLRLCNIPAKVVMCIPSIEPSQDCHVVVQAYSYDLGRWVLLDPTYHLILRTADGTYVDLRRLRSALATGEALVPNPDAGHNGMPFSMEYYRAYMAKNTFRFSCPTVNAFDAKDGVNGNTVQMLVPDGWEVPYRWSRPERLTTSADDFWAPPPPRLDWDEPGPAAPNGSDCFVMGNETYVNASDVRWVATRMLDRGEMIGEIGRSGIQADKLENWDATVIPMGAKVYRLAGYDDTNIVLVPREGVNVPYRRVAG